MKKITDSNAAPAPKVMEEIRFFEEEPIRVDTIIEDKRKISAYTPDYLERQANQNLGPIAQERFGRAAARLTDTLNEEPETFAVGDRDLTFPGVSYEISFEGRDKRRGVLVHQVSFREPMLDDPARMLLTLGCLALEPTKALFALSFPFEPLSCLKPLKKSGWKVESQLPTCVIAHHDAAGFSLKLEMSEITLFRFPSVALWANPLDPNSGNLLTSLGALISRITTAE
jgi:hypothetical protein